MVNNVKIEIKSLNVWFGKKHVIKNVNIKIKPNAVTAVMGPSGCGKTTLIRAINRLNELIKGSRTTGQIFIDNENVYSKEIDVYELRRQVGMVFQKPNPFPKSIYENVAFGPKLHKMANEKELDEIVAKSLKGAALWDEVQDRLNDDAFSLSGGQQQRLCIARALAVEPDIILMDEPCSALDPAATAEIETLIRELRKSYTVIVVTHNLQQAARISDYTAFLYVGELVEYGLTKTMFEKPENELVEQYITGKFG
ncbi:MAG: phosphate ABC transporter ATP-binding protein PstB [Candidatus Bathyarchaeota archaeon]|nr:phosphate ABC transporter ATP-binding protein PstB [Candidatus Bathyarchaeota archaeon]